jgi:hypothetical protein
MILSKHFIINWRQRVSGYLPTPDQVADIVKESVRIQHGHDVMAGPRGGFFRVLAIYWDPSRDIIIKVDQAKNVAVTVMTSRLARTQKQQRKVA